VDRYPELDVLRGIACLAVVFFHYLSRGPEAGWTGNAVYPSIAHIAAYWHFGVQLFFMISGFVIYKSARGRTVKDFAIARFWRLFPAYWVAILVTTYFMWLFGAELFIVSVRDFFWNFTMFQQFADAASVDGSYWSLMVEMIFYCYIALAIQLRIIERTYLLITVALGICALNLVINSFKIDLFLLAQWSPYFVIGIVGSLIRDRGCTAKDVGFFVLALGLAILRLYLDAIRLPKHSFTPDAFVVAAIALIFIVVVSRKWGFKPNRLSNTLGAMTYPVYLLHQNIGYVLLVAITPLLGAGLSLIVVLAYVLIMSRILNELIEVRLVRFFKKR
jgi:peptidoglycan/LPS O-acetylase OafA/YrhL